MTGTRHCLLDATFRISGGDRVGGNRTCPRGTLYCGVVKGAFARLSHRFVLRPLVPRPPGVFRPAGTGQLVPGWVCCSPSVAS